MGDKRLCTVNMKLLSGIAATTIKLNIIYVEEGKPEFIQIHQTGEGMGASWRV